MMMCIRAERASACGVYACVALASFGALAQDLEPPVTLEAPTSTPPATTTPATTPSTTSTTPSASTPAPTASAPAAATDSHRPTDGWSLGLGTGWFFPTDILVPNTASVRIMFPGSVTIEPFLNLSLGGSDNVQEVDDPINSSDLRSDFTGSDYTAALGTAVRVPIFTRGNLDLQFIGSASASYSASDLTGDQELGGGDPRASTTDSQTISVGASYGAGIEWFFLPNLALSADAQNPLASWTRTDSRTAAEVDVFDPNTGEVIVDERITTNRGSSFDVGAIFDPSVRVMVHLYF